MKKVFFLAATLLIPLFASAQVIKPVIRFSPFYTQGVGIEETRFIESLIQSYLSDLGEVVNYFDNSVPSASFSVGGDFPGDWTKSPDYVVSGSIYLNHDSRIFTLEIHNTNTRESSRSTTVHKTASDLVLKARSLVESVIKTRAAPGTGDSERKDSPETISENIVSGTWRGESGIEMIRLQQGGRGIAFFSSGAQMSLSYMIENNILKVKQNSPNLERFYYPLPYDIARKLSAEADPMYWELMLYSGGSHLKGVKITTEVKISQNGLVEIVNGATRDSLWIRSGR